MVRRIFVPVCLYSSAPFRRRSEVARVCSILRESESLTIICDDLHSLYLALTRRDLPMPMCRTRARNAGANVEAMWRKEYKRYGVTGQIKRWDEASREEGFARFALRAEEVLSCSAGYRRVMDGFIKVNLRRFRREGETQAYEWESEYLTAEVLMSLYVTEVLGFELEVWERPPPLTIMGPLEYLYAEERSLVKELVGGSLRRRRVLLHELEIDDAPRENLGAVS